MRKKTEDQKAQFLSSDYKKISLKTSNVSALVLEGLKPFTLYNYVIKFETDVIYIKKESGLIYISHSYPSYKSYSGVFCMDVFEV